MSSSTADQLIEELKRDADKGELLLWAAARGLQNDVEELVRTGADPSVKDKALRQAAHYAASNGHASILEYLATKGVDLDAEDGVGRGALHYAAAGGHSDCVSLLLARGCWRDAPDGADDTPLHLAARSGDLAAVKALAEAGAKAWLPNKRSLTPFAEAVLAGRTAAAEWLGARAEGGLAAALAEAYRGVPLLHLAAGMGQATAVEWLLRQPGAEPSAPACAQRLTPLHAAALAGDADTVRALLAAGADPLTQTLDGQLPLELVPRSAPRKAPPPPPPPGTLPSIEPTPEAAAKEAAAEAARVRAARRAFKALARAAAEQGVLAGGQGVAALGASGGGAAAAEPEPAAAGKARAKGKEKGKERRAEEGAGEEAEHPVALFLRQFSALSPEQQAAKVEALSRMDEREVKQLPYMDADALAALTGLRTAGTMVELFTAVAALRSDEEFQSDIGDARVRAALEEIKKTNNLERYETQPAIMSVAAKFKRLHAINRKAGALKVVLDDLRADLPGNDPASTAAKAAEFAANQAACAASAAQAVLRSAQAALPQRNRARAEAQAEAESGAEAGMGVRRRGKNATGDGPLEEEGGTGKDGKGKGGEEEEDDKQREGEDDAAFRERLANRSRVDRLRAAATSAWVNAHSAADDVGFVDRFSKNLEAQAARAEGRYRKRLADYVGEEVAQSLVHTLKALALTLLAFAALWVLGLMPHQQTQALLARQAVQEAAKRAAEAVRRVQEGAAACGGGVCDVSGALGEALLAEEPLLPE
ncbi:hypothetical protein HYH03_002512 [Edaphochlamys debaryana]|uniref:Uncharacterized protein n=1 Tax=Edaphochlamys debaryana TaxID=47281 RepID=A0A835YDE8_9CHLO|nr:hypothetical protein HYH03_002512 [Edaphochlamys debaryana]|eukprot:KAG2499567.1 hypothetical protein HYH03_002512 [Edaphochlamys debaryana]